MGSNFREILCEKRVKILDCIEPVEEALGKCIKYDLSPFLPIVKNFYRDFCTLHLDVWLNSETEHKCIDEKLLKLQMCAGPLLSSLVDKEKAEMVTAVADLLTTNKHCDEIKSSIKCFNESIKNCTDKEKNVSAKLIQDLTSETKCFGLGSGATAHKISSFLSVVGFLTLLKKCI